MSPIRSSLLLGAGDAAAGGFQVSRSLRFNASDSAYLSRTPAVAGNRKKWSFSWWQKKAMSTTGQQMVFGVISGTVAFDISFSYSAERLTVEQYVSGAMQFEKITQRVLRDPSAWYHFLVAYDSDNGTADDRILIYVNGVRETTFYLSTNPSPGLTTPVNDTVLHAIGRYGTTDSYYLSSYLSNIQYIDGQALTPSSFTEVSATTGQLIPKAYSGTYGTNGFYLKFADNSTTAALGTDTSGNGNTWTVNNFAVSGVPWATSTYLSSTTNYPGYPVANGFDNDVNSQWLQNTQGGTVTFSNFSISYTSSVKIKLGGSGATVRVNGGTGQTIAANSFISVASGSGTLTSLSWQANGSEYPAIYGIQIDDVLLVAGVPGDIDSLVDTPTSYGTDTGVGGEVRGNYCTWNPLARTNSVLPALTNGNLDVGANTTAGTVLGSIALSSGKWYWEITVNTIGAALIGAASTFTVWSSQPGYLANSAAYLSDGRVKNNGSDVGTYASYTTGDVIGVALNMDAGAISFYKNNSLIVTVSSSISGTWTPAVSDWNAVGSILIANFGQRAFSYTAPANFKAICDSNLPAPLVAKPNTLMDVALWTGDNTSPRSITGLAFNPDLVWVKERSAGTYYHRLFDAVRGTSNSLYSASTDAENTFNAGYSNVTSFNSDGFTLTGLNGGNNSAVTYVGWCWDAGTSTVPNTQGSITSQVRANATAGFSVVTFTAPSSGSATIGHGLGVEPYMVIIKSRDQSYNWCVYHKNLTSNAYFLNLNTTAAQSNASNVWNNTTPTSTVFSLGGGYAGAGATVAYVFSPVVGYSAMGSYVSNSNSDGPFIWTGFRSRFLMIKNTTDTTYSAYNGWFMVDTARTPANVPPGNANALYANKSQVENTDGAGAYSPQLAVDILANGFKLRCANTEINYNATYIYFAVAENPFQYARAR